MSVLDSGAVGSPPLAVFDRLAGRYTVGPRQDRGPATDTHHGWDHHRERPVTIELYRATARPAQRYRRERQVMALAGLHHPAVLAVHDRGRDPASGVAYVVTEPLDGLTLEERIRRGPQSASRVLALGVTLADVLAHLHGAGLVHRRLTPSTITMDRHAGPVLHDLDGVATLDVEAVTLEEAFALADTGYLAPEQVAGHEVGPTADVYSLARILEACLAAPATHVGAPPDVPATPTPAAMRGVFDAMTDPDPERRPGAARVAGELRAVSRTAAPPPAPPPAPSPAAAGERSRSRPAADAARARPAPRRARRRAGLVAAAALALAVEVAALGSAVAAGHDASANHPNGVSVPR